MYLLDTNIWLERLLEQAHAAEVKQLLDTVAASALYYSQNGVKAAPKEAGAHLGPSW